MPREMALQLEEQGAVFWEAYLKVPLNNWDTRGFLSQEIGYVETCLGMEPPASAKKAQKEESVFSGIADLGKLAEYF